MSAAKPVAAEPAKCSTAADGKTAVYNIPGHPLMVRAVDFNAAISESGFVCANCKAKLKAGYTCGKCGSDEAEPAKAAAVPEAVERDAARYRWLREESQYFPQGKAPAVVLCGDGDLFQKGDAGSDSGFIYGGALDAAIDAAIAKATGEQP